MRWGIILVIAVAALMTATMTLDREPDYPEQKHQPAKQSAIVMRVTSTAFSQGEMIPSKYTCDGDNVNPTLEFHHIDPSARSLVLFMDDPDAPSGTWDHWILWNLSPDETVILEGSDPKAVHGRTSSGDLGYGGPCPPHGSHRYFFRVYALDSLLDLSEGSSKRQVESAMSGKILQYAELMGTYSRTM